MAALRETLQTKPRYFRRRWLAAFGAAWLISCSNPPPPPPAPVEAPPPAKTVPPPTPPTPDVQRAVMEAVFAEDRSEEDVALDEGRKPQRLLTFFGVGPGMRVAELAAGGGYTAELLARVVGPNGTVYGQNSPFLLKRFAEAPWSERLKKPVMANVKRLDREFVDPLPEEATNLDVVTMVLFYHDMVWQGVDRARMNEAVFKALKPGGVFGIVDHSAREGSGVEDVETLHRIEESVLRNEIEQAGFMLQESADFLRNPDDTRDWNASPRVAGERRGQSDRFVLKFAKPN